MSDLYVSRQKEEFRDKPEATPEEQSEPDMHEEVREYIGLDKMGSGSAIVVLALLVLLHAAFFLILLPPPTATGQARLALLIYLGGGLYILLSALFGVGDGPPLLATVVRCFRSTRWRVRLFGLFYLLWLTFSLISLYPLWLAVGLVGFGRGWRELIETDGSGTASNPQLILYSAVFTEQDFNRANRTAVVLSLAGVFILALLMGLPGVEFEVTLLLWLQVTAIASYMVMHVVMGNDLRLAAKRKRGSVIWNAAAIVAYVLLLGVVGATLVDLTRLDLSGGFLVSVVSLLWNNSIDLISPEQVPRLLAGPGVMIWKVGFYLLAYYFVGTEIFSLSVLRGWKRDERDWIWLAGMFFRAGNSAGGLDAINRAEKIVGQSDGLPSMALRIRAYCRIDQGDEETALKTLMRIPVKFDLTGRSELFWLSERRALRNDLQGAIRLLRRLEVDNPGVDELRSRIEYLEDIVDSTPGKKEIPRNWATEVWGSAASL